MVDELFLDTVMRTCVTDRNCACTVSVQLPFIQPSDFTLIVLHFRREGGPWRVSCMRRIPVQEGGVSVVSRLEGNASWTSVLYI